MSSFIERQKNLFDHLKEAERKHKGLISEERTSSDYGTIDRQTYRRVKCEMKRFRGKESIYKRPEATLRECLRSRAIPDHIKNPHKWTYYSLADVTPDQMSEATNTATALAFLKEMEERELAKIKMDIDETDVEFKKPTFHVSKMIKKEHIDNHGIMFKNNKVIMPEYVVGASQKKKKIQRIKEEKNDNMEEIKNVGPKLEHLYDE
ncbi:Protein TSSC4 [Eumeta japonica]|uniref:U5 small nuclear ribonucleoprotein TSSC4 n=1 Tax=Eumeta variegata TaxID=151549 RepID=A0A4C1TY94_EUMVA|nr:Protein TSSC4 [Eumeta japonica]